jgi:hypothetical protein
MPAEHDGKIGNHTWAQLDAASTPVLAAPPSVAPPVIPTATAATASCSIDVRATHIGGILSSLPIWHTFIVYTDGTGSQSYFRGGPGGVCAGVTGQYGTIQSASGAYVAGTVDWSPGAPSVTAMSGAGACGKNATFASELSRIDGLCRPYAPTGPNSNTVTRTLLANSGVSQVKPVSIAPGWGDSTL